MERAVHKNELLKRCNVLLGRRYEDMLMPSGVTGVTASRPLPCQRHRGPKLVRTKAGSLQRLELGEFYVLEDGRVAEKHVDLIEVSRRLGALAETEFPVGGAD